MPRKDTRDRVIDRSRPQDAGLTVATTSDPLPPSLGDTGRYLRADGTVALTGPLAVSDGVTLDGVDLSAHAINPDAHHAALIGLAGSSGLAIPDATDRITIAGGAGLTSSASGSTLTLTPVTPATLSVTSSNNASAHTHAVSSSSAPGASAALLATNASGGLTLDSTLLVVDASADRIGIGMAPTGARLDVTGGASEAAVRVTSTVTTAHAIELAANNLTTGALINATLPAARSLIQGRVNGDTQPRVQLLSTGLLLGSGSATPDVMLRWAGANHAVLDNNGLGGAVDLSVSRKITAGATTPGAALITSIWAGGAQLRLGYDATNYMDFFVDNGGSLTFAPTGDLILDPGGNDVVPLTSYDINLGGPTRKFLGIYGAELAVETLVAQDTIATMGGRVLIAPTTPLMADVASGGVTVSVKHNQMQPGDIVYTEGGGNVEFFSVNTGPTGTGPYSYTLTRNLDGTGSNAWAAGDALVNTGQTGSGFLDLYSLHGITGMLFDAIFVLDAGAAASPYETGVFSANYAQSARWAYLPSPLGINDSVYYGVATPWNNLYHYWASGATWNGAAVTPEYWNGSAWVAVSVTITGAWTAGTFGLEWASGSLTNWTSKTINGVTAYWLRIRTTNAGSGAQPPMQGTRRVFWQRRTFGPTITAQVRTSNTFNAFEPHAAFGNLEGTYDYSQPTYGLAAGRYGGASGTTPWLAVDATNGIRMMRGSAKLGQWATDGTITVGQVASGQGNVLIDSGGLRLRTSTTPKIDLQTDGDVLIGSNVLSPATTFMSMFSVAQTYNGESMAAGNVLLGDNSSNRANILWTPADARLRFRGGTTTQAYIDTDGSFVSGADQLKINEQGMILQSGSSYIGNPQWSGSVQWRLGGSSTARLWHAKSGTSVTDSIFSVYVPTTTGGTSRSSRVRLTAQGYTGNDAMIDVVSYQSSSGAASRWIDMLGDLNITGYLKVGTPGYNPVGTTNLSVQGAIVAGGYVHPGNQTNYGFSFIAAPYGLPDAIYNNGNLVNAGYVTAANWFRSIGATGWYNQTYGGGIWQTAAGYVETYGGTGFKSNGTMGINVAPISNHALTINGVGTTSASYGLVVRDSAGTNRMYVRDDGQGNYVSSNWDVGSDQKWKHNIQDLTPADHQKARRIPIRTYQRTDDTRLEIGLVAQEVQTTHPDQVSQDMNGDLAVNYVEVLLAKVAALEAAVYGSH